MLIALHRADAKITVVAIVPLRPDKSYTYIPRGYTRHTLVRVKVKPRLISAKWLPAYTMRARARARERERERE